MPRLGRGQPNRSSSGQQPAIVTRSNIRGAIPIGRTPPVYGAPAQTTWTGGGTKSTTVGGSNGSGSLTWNPGDLILVLAITGDSTLTLAKPTATGLSFGDLGSPVVVASSCWGHKWVATAGAAGSGTISAVPTPSTGDWGLIAWVISGSDGVGNFAGAAATAQTISLTTTQAHSAVFEAIGDWGAGSITGRSWTPTQQTERQAQQDAGAYSSYTADWADRSGPATTSYGISVTASGSNYTKIAVEILGQAQLFSGTWPVSPSSNPIHPGRGPSRMGRFFAPSRNAGYTAGTSDVSVPATEALGTGTAYDANVIIAPNATAATGTGTAYDANASIGAAPTAATNTGTAYGPTASIAGNAGSATGTGTVGSAPNIAPNAIEALGTGTAYDATVTAAGASVGAFASSIHPGRGPSRMGRFFAPSRNAGYTALSQGNAPATEALGTGTAYNASVIIAPNATAATGTGTAYDATGSVGAASTAATGTGTAYGPTVTITGNSGAATGTGTTGSAPNIAPNATAATGTGTAYSPDYVEVRQPVALPHHQNHPGRGPSTARFWQRPGAFTSLDGLIFAAASTGAGVAYDATISLGVVSAAALATVAANNAQSVLLVNATTGTGTGTAYAVANGIDAMVDAAPALGAALPNDLWTAHPRRGITSRPNNGITVDPG